MVTLPFENLFFERCGNRESDKYAMFHGLVDYTTFHWTRYKKLIFALYTSYTHVQSMEKERLRKGRYKSKREFNQLDRLFDALGKGSVALKQAERINVRENQHSWIPDIGEKSEGRVYANLIRLRDVVRNIRKTEKNGREDKAGIDLIVMPKKKTGVDEVYVEIVSSERGIKKFRNEFAIHTGLEGEEEINEGLIRGKRMVINGQLTREEIKRSFLEQFNDIRSYQETHKLLK